MGRHQWAVQNFLCWFLRRSRSHRDKRNTISATGACKMLAVAQKPLSFVQSDFLLCPKDVIPQAIGDVGEFVLYQANYTCVVGNKLRIVCGNDRFALCGFQ